MLFDVHTMPSLVIDTTPSSVHSTPCPTQSKSPQTPSVSSPAQYKSPQTPSDSSPQTPSVCSPLTLQVADPNERRRLALAEIDKAPFGWYHVRAVVVAGIGFFTDAYDIFAVGLITAMLGVVFWQDQPLKPGLIPSDAETAIKVATSSGTVVGQLVFGALADVLGRKKMYGMELILVIFATLSQSMSAASPAMSITGVLVFWRVLMGIGIGGDYPLSSIITSE